VDLYYYRRKIIMRLSIKKPLTGFLVASALALSAVGAEANGNANGPDAYIGISGGSPQGYNYSANGNINGGYDADMNRGYPNDGGWGHSNGGYHTGY
jgi:hypothetical protein